MLGIEDKTYENANIQLSVFPSISTNIFSIRFSISEEEAEEDISLKVYNKAGIMVKDLFRGKKPAGTHTITLNGDKLPNDVYFISLKKGKIENPIRKVILLR
jgi:flagellar hook assembly protein FlgD